MTVASSFGVGLRESHDSSAFYGRRLFNTVASTQISEAYQGDLGWADQLYLGSCLPMTAIPDNSIGLVFTSPPYNVGKDYDEDMDLNAYLLMLALVGQELYRVLRPGGRYVLNVANLGRKPYIPLTHHMYTVHGDLGFLPVGEVIWQKAKGAAGNCAWGSWKSAKAPNLRDLHEYLLVFTKECYGRPDKGVSTIEGSEFMDATLSIWNIPAESAKRVGHPAPFPLALAERVIKLFSYQDDVVLDPFMGSGTTCVAAKRLGRHYVGYDIVAEYVALATTRLSQVTE